VRDIRLLVAKGHRAHEALELDGLAGEALADEGGLGDHALPALALALARAEDLEHLVLRDPAHLRERDRELGRLLLALLLERAAQRLRVPRALAVEQVRGQRAVRRGRGVRLLDVPLVVRAQRLLERDLLRVPARVQQLGLVADRLLRDGGRLVRLARGALAPAAAVSSSPYRGGMTERARTFSQSSLGDGHGA
jgi:hypothetical protein